MCDERWTHTQDPHIHLSTQLHRLKEKMMWAFAFCHIATTSPNGPYDWAEFWLKRSANPLCFGERDWSNLLPYSHPISKSTYAAQVATVHHSISLITWLTASCTPWLIIILKSLIDTHWFIIPMWIAEPFTVETTLLSHRYYSYDMFHLIDVW